ncbi:pentatricopeptide repeat-containing protein At3g22150, chloroplastic [Gastrolobium bilobum]|uniref:pentatricopeptide repeat-containing protein At3g22150, chloroplastic n=1 Tax=Gastrolobium bilobum TaxID=150636 RepID=UPI002AB173A2|nr:pentatricopeptide repeat-containing protein At3g22150, chloroplastic [Gastrolobium bilobum]
MRTMSSPVVPVTLSAPIPSSDATHHISVSNPKEKYKNTTLTIRSRLSQLCQQGQPHLARHLLDTLPRPSTVVWNAVIIGFICNNLPLEALLLYAQMKSIPGTHYDSYTFSSTLKACALTHNLMAGKALHSHIIRCQSNPSPSRIVYNSLLNMYSSCLPTTIASHFQHDYVLKVFDVMRKRNVVAWNTLISWYVKTERPLQALIAFTTMMKLTITPTAVTFVNVFPAVSKFGDYKIASVIYGLLLKFGAEYVNDVFAVSSAVLMFADLGFLDHARLVFDQCSRKSTEVWNTMIGGYVQNNRPIQGIDVFIQALESDEAICDDVTFLSVITAVSQLQQIKLAEQLHAFVLKSLTVLPIIILNAIIVMYSRCNYIDTSFKVFDKMFERDSVSWNTIISAFVQNGLDEEALMLVCEMQKQRFMIDSVTVTALLSAASNLRNSYIGRQTHAYLIRHGIQFEGMESYLIDMYAKSSLIRTSELLFEQNCPSVRDRATWNAMIAGYTQNGLNEKAILILRETLMHKVMPNAVTLASILPACSSMGSIAFTRQLHGFSIRHFLDQNVYVGTALVDTYSKSGAISYAENVFVRTPEKNSVTYTTMMMSYGQHGMGKRALTLYDTMLRSCIKPDAVTFVAILSACSYAGLVDEGLQIFKSMEKVHKIKPSIEHYCCVADMLGRVGRVVEAYEFVNGLGGDGDAMEIWGSLLGACKNHGYFELGKVIAEKLLNMETGKGMAGYHVLLSNIYAEEREWENVDRLRNQMKEKGLQKEMGCSWVEIAGFVNCFVSRDEKHPQSGEIYYILDKLTMDMKDVGYKPRYGSNLNMILESNE